MNKLLPLLALLAGCSLIPSYERPAAPVPDQWPTGSAVSPAPIFTGDWQTFFADPQLRKLIAAALAHNRDLRIAVARVEEARALAGIARADRFPTVDVNFQQQAAQVFGRAAAQLFVGSVDDGAADGKGMVEVTGHAGFLGALAGEEEGGGQCAGEGFAAGHLAGA